MRTTFKILTLFFLCSCLHQVSKAQVPLQKFVDADTITWLGIDFTHTVFIDGLTHKGFNDPVKIRDFYFKAWNDMVFTEPDKFNLSRFFKKPVIYNMSLVDSANLLVEIDKAFKTFSNDASMGNMTSKHVEEVVKQYSFDGMSGYGAMLVMANLNKQKATATGYMVFLSLDTGDILYLRKMQEAASGFGFRNYWLSTYYIMYKELRHINLWLRDAKTALRLKEKQIKR